ncbi:MAG TPA: hypothetical protein VH813_00380 [Candidatus Limnocylindrales bacterium]|jgi:hypothetical protein
MGRQALTEAGRAMLDVLRRRGGGAFDVADAFTPLIENRAALLERDRIREAIESLPTSGGLLDREAVLAAIEAAGPDEQKPGQLRGSRAS